MASSSASDGLGAPLRGQEQNPRPEEPLRTYQEFLDKLPAGMHVWAFPADWAGRNAKPILIGISCVWNNPSEIDPVKETFRTKVEISLVFVPQDRLLDESGKPRSFQEMLGEISVIHKPWEIKRIKGWEENDKALFKLLTYARQESKSPGGQSQLLFDRGLAIPIIDLKNTVKPPQCINEKIDMIPGKEGSQRLVTVYLEFQGLFRTTFEMQSYPWDRQLLPVEVGTKVETTEQVFVPYNVVKPPRPCSGFKGDKFVDEYEVVGHHLYIKPLSEIEPVLSGKKYGRAFMVLLVQRSPSWAGKNIYGFIFGFVFSTNTCFALNDLVSRVIVGAVASVCISIYRIAIAAVLPKKRYQTRADWYIFGAVALTVLLNFLFYLESAFGLLGGDNKSRSWIDIFLQIVFVFGWIGFHVVYYCKVPKLYPRWSQVHTFKEEAVLTATPPVAANPPQVGTQGP